MYVIRQMPERERREDCPPDGGRDHVSGLNERPGYDARSDVHPFQVSRLDVTGFELWTRVIAQAADGLVGFNWLAFCPEACSMSSCQRPASSVPGGDPMTDPERALMSLKLG